MEQGYWKKKKKEKSPTLKTHQCLYIEAMYIIYIEHKNARIQTCTPWKSENIQLYTNKQTIVRAG